METDCCERQGGRGDSIGVQRPASSTQRITMVTAIRELRGVRLGQRGRLERQLTEESPLTLDDSTDSPPPQGCARPDAPRDHRILRNRDVAIAVLFLMEKIGGTGAQ